MKQHTSKSYATLEWMKSHAISIASLDPQSSSDDLSSFKQVVGDANIVALGEASHGVHEYFVLKHRLFQFLVEHMGFTLFAMEMSWMGAECINEYVLTGQGDPRALLEGNGFNCWKTKEVLDLILWMQSYNADPTHHRKVRFAGFDGVSIEGAGLDRIITYFQTVDPQRANEVAILYNQMPRSAVWPSLPESVLQQNAEAAQRVLALLKEQEETYTHRSSPEIFAVILQEANVVSYVAHRKANTVAFDLASTEFLTIYENRDRFMAQNVRWLHEHAEGGEKMVLWAHNWHIGTWGTFCCDPQGNNGPFRWMGHDLQEWFGNKYLRVGFTFFEGAINSYLTDRKGDYLSEEWLPHTIKQAQIESYDFMLNEVGSLYILDLRNVPPGEVQEWLYGSRSLRVFDTDYCADEARYYHQVSLPKWFDAIIHVCEVSPSQMLANSSKA